MSNNLTVTATPRNVPILSGPPPVVESSTCRQCAKPFNPLWRRAHACGHCGYEYCAPCISDGQALMPRRAGESSSPSTGPLAEIRAGLGLDEKKTGLNGYEVESVCLPCLSMLQVTAAPVSILRSLPLKRLKDYLAAYGIPCVGPSEKEDFVQAVIKARNPATGSLTPEAESYYRRRSVPKQGQLPSGNAALPARSQPLPRTQARPPPPTNFRPASHPQPPPPPFVRPFPPSARQPPPQAQAPPSTPSQRRPAPAAKTAQPRQPEPPVPTILSLVSLPKSYLASLSIGTLKAILYENHVRVDFKQVLEKEELINRVSELITDERKRLERQRIEEERLANGEAPGADGLAPPEDDEAGDRPRKSTDTGARVPTGPMPEIERGLCVVCQDEEATLAVIDCGHLAMCAHCSDLIMATSQECPLCRTRIVTPLRLIRIYRV